ncbi:MAG: glycosyltransferase family 39 protein, partial [Gemmatimonadaceae bacterium]
MRPMHTLQHLQAPTKRVTTETPAPSVFSASAVDVGKQLTFVRSETISQSVTVCVVFCVALALRIVFIALTTITPISDSGMYLEHASNVRSGAGLISSNGTATAVIPPAYPFLIACVQSLANLNDDTTAVAYAQALLGALTAALSVVLARRFLSGMQAAITGGLVALAPTSIVYAGELMTEVPTTFLLVVALLLLTVPETGDTAQGRSCLSQSGAGIVMGVAVLFRPAVLAFGLGVALWLASGAAPRRRRARAVMAFGVGMALVVTPWTARNYRVSNRLVLISSNGGYNLYLGNNSKAWSGGWMPLSQESEPDTWADEFIRDREASQRATGWILANPTAYAKVTARRALTWVSLAPDYIPGVRLTSTSEVDDALVREYRARWSRGAAVVDPAELSRSKRRNHAILLIWSIVTIPTALVGFVTGRRTKAEWVCLCPLVTYAAILSLTFMQSRFREVVWPIWLAYSTVGVSQIPTLLRLGRSRRVTWMAAPGILVAAAFCLQLWR